MTLWYFDIVEKQMNVEQLKKRLNEIKMKKMGLDMEKQRLEALLKKKESGE